MGEQQRQRARTATFGVYHVQRVSPDLGALLAQSVEPELKSVGVKHTPVRQEGVQPVAGTPRSQLAPRSAELSIAVQPAAELAQRIGG